MHAHVGDGLLVRSGRYGDSPEARCTPERRSTRPGGRTEAAAQRLTAVPGDRLLVAGHVVGEPSRQAEILEVRGPDGGAPFLVRWEDDGAVGLVFPGSDARIRHRPGPWDGGC